MPPTPSTMIKNFVSAALLLAFMTGCSSVSVKDVSAQAGVTKPARIYVAPLSTASGNYKVAGTKDPAAVEAFAQNASSILADYTVQNISKHVAPATRVASAASAPKRGWLVTGRLTRLSTGSRGLRVLVGLGAGGTKMETAVEVYDLGVNSRKPFLTFHTTGGSNAMPGLLSSTGPASAALSMISQAATGVTDDAARTSRMITGALSEYHVEHGWIPKEKVFKTKKLGQYQLIHGM